MIIHHGFLNIRIVVGYPKTILYIEELTLDIPLCDQLSRKCTRVEQLSG